MESRDQGGMQKGLAQLSDGSVTKDWRDYIDNGLKVEGDFFPL